MLDKIPEWVLWTLALLFTSISFCAIIYLAMTSPT